MKIIKALTILLLVALISVTLISCSSYVTDLEEDPKEETEKAPAEETTTEEEEETPIPEELYNEYIKNELIASTGLCLGRKLDFESYRNDLIARGNYYDFDSAYSKGLVSAHINDFNKDGVPEMVTVTLDIEQSQQWEYTYTLLIDLYTIENGEVVYSKRIDAVEKFRNEGSELFVYQLNGENEDMLVITHYDWTGSPGGSVFGDTFDVYKMDGSAMETFHKMSYSYAHGTEYYTIDGTEYCLSDRGLPVPEYNRSRTIAKNLLKELGLEEFIDESLDVIDSIRFPKTADHQKIFSCGTDYDYAYITDYTGIGENEYFRYEVIEGEDVIAAYKEAADFYSKWFYGQYYADWDDHIGDHHYGIKHDTIKSYEDLFNATSKYFTVEDTQTLLEYIDAKDEHGKLYVKAYGVGSSPYKHEYVVYKLSEDSAIIQIRSYDILSEDPTQFITHHSVCTKEDEHWMFNDYRFFVNTVYN